MRPHIDDEIFRVREFMKELAKVQDNYYKDLENRVLLNRMYSVDKVKKDLEEITGASTLIESEQDLKEWFWDYMYNEAETKDFMEYLFDAQGHCNEFMKKNDERIDTREQ